MNPLWRNLSSKVINLLKEKPILYPYDSSQLYLEAQLFKPRNLRTLPANYLINGSPLFADRPGINRKYLSLSYEHEDVEILRAAFQLHDIEDIYMFHRIKRDLESPGSVMKNAETPDGWHSLAAGLIATICERSPEVGDMIKQELNIIPLSDGRWVTASTEDLHFPAREGPAIPPDLVTTIHHQADRNHSRRNLFQRLGVTSLSPAMIIDRLWASYRQHNGASNLEASKAHLGYLYWHYADIDDARFSRLWIYDRSLNRVTCQHGVIYMSSIGEYSPLELLRAVPDPTNPGELVPECSAAFVNVEYMTLFLSITRRHDLSWLGWLERALGVRRIPRLKYPAGSLSAEFRHILRYRPEKIVRLLKMYWQTYRREMNNRIEEEISQADVTCEDGLPCVLSRTYFPTQRLTRKARELKVPQSFPFLAVPGLSEEDRAFEEWRFLERFHVKFEANLEFYLDVLLEHAAGIHQVWDSDTRSCILKIYELIADHCNGINRDLVV